MNQEALDRTGEFLRKFARPAVPGLPKYAQLREMLMSAITTGHWKPGDKLPTESQLAQVAPFSLGTVQRALRELVEEGLVVRTQGAGTFVAEGRGAIGEPLHLRFVGGEGEPPFLPLMPGMLGRERIRSAGPWSEWLGSTDIVRIDRRLSVNGEFNVFNRFYVRADQFPEAYKRPIASLGGVNFKHLFGGSFNMPITAVKQRLSMVKFTPEACRGAAVKPGTRGLLLESVGSAGRTTPVYYLESYIPPNERKLDVSAN
jgi:GntR family transcriptional regulator